MLSCLDTTENFTNISCLKTFFSNFLKLRYILILLSNINFCQMLKTLQLHNFHLIKLVKIKNIRNTSRRLFVSNVIKPDSNIHIILSVYISP